MMKEKEGTEMTHYKKKGMTRGDESGRSMVEMLGVLAIMGVLVIGGIAGYRYAMDKYNANEILNEVRKRAVTVSQQRILGQPIDLSEWSTTIQGHPVTAAGSYNGNMSFFSLTVSGIEKGVCDKVIAEKIPFVVEEKIGDVVVEEDTACAEGEICTTSGTAENSQCYISEGECTRNEDCKTPDGRVDTTKYCAFENPVSSLLPGIGTCRDKGSKLTSKNVSLG